ncbi:replication protein P [Haemophilus haemoglobinophilus]|nr:replication protein P [Canicola haemoglobinophilus]
MKTFENATALIGSEPNYSAPVTQGQKQEIPEQVAKYVDRLFVRLKAIFPGWKAAFSSDAEYEEAKAAWLQALVNNGITKAELFKRGLQLAERSESPFLPSVGQFISWCKSGNEFEELGLPTPETLLQRYQAFRASCEEPENYPWQSAAEFHLVSQLKRAIYQENLDHEKSLKKARSLIKSMAKYLKEGGQLAEPTAKKLTAPKEQVLSPEECAKAFAEIRKQLSGATKID